MDNKVMIHTKDDGLVDVSENALQALPRLNRKVTAALNELREEERRIFDVQQNLTQFREWEVRQVEFFVADLRMVQAVSMAEAFTTYKKLDHEEYEGSIFYGVTRTKDIFKVLKHMEALDVILEFQRVLWNKQELREYFPRIFLQ